MIYKGQHVDEINHLEAQSPEAMNDLVKQHAKGYEIVDLTHLPQSDGVFHAQIVLKKLPERQQINEG